MSGCCLFEIKKESSFGIIYLCLIPGGKVNFEFLNLDNYVFPQKGLHFNIDLSFLGGLKNDNTNFGILRSELAFYQSLDKKENLVFASKLGFSHNIGDNAEFYHLPTLGGKESLRGYRFERFYGETAFWQNIDLRARLFSSYNKTLPFTFGLYAGFNHGRIWADIEGYPEKGIETWFRLASSNLVYPSANCGY